MWVKHSVWSKFSVHNPTSQHSIYNNNGPLTWPVSYIFVENPRDLFTTDTVCYNIIYYNKYACKTSNWNHSVKFGNLKPTFDILVKSEKFDHENNTPVRFYPTMQVGSPILLFSPLSFPYIESSFIPVAVILDVQRVAGRAIKVKYSTLLHAKIT